MKAHFYLSLWVSIVGLHAATTEAADWRRWWAQPSPCSWGSSLPNGLPFLNDSGFAATESAAGCVDLKNEFFQDLGRNGRRCVSCHLPNAGWTITPATTQAVFAATAGGRIDGVLGLGAIFRPNDGANSPLADTSTLAARRSAYSMLLTKGLIRTGLKVPDDADFELVAVDDPYRYASAAELSLFRRPLPITNLKFLSAIMWDGRETTAGDDHCNLPSAGGKCFAAIHFDLSTQSNTATITHAEGAPLSDAQREAIVDFELGLSTAQVWDRRARDLSSRGARGGLPGLVAQDFYYGINDNLGDYRSGQPFTPEVFSLYAGWRDSWHPARTAVARGEALFNTRKITISKVAGLTGMVGTPFKEPFPEPLVGTCTTCHNTPNAGNHSIVAPLNIGISDASRRTPDMPLYTFRNKSTGETVQSTDPGRALVSGKFVDIGKFKGPILRGLAARAPYFHNGMAKDLDAVLDFYNTRFDMNLTAEERADLLAFLRAL